MTSPKRKLGRLTPAEQRAYEANPPVFPRAWAADLLDSEIEAAIAYLDAIEAAATSGGRKVEPPVVTGDTMLRTYVYALGQRSFVRAFEETDNPAFCWLAWTFARRAGRLAPSYAYAYLDRCAESVSQAIGSRRRGGKGRSDLQLMKDFGFSRGRGPSTTTRAEKAFHNEVIFSLLCGKLLEGVVDNETAFIDISEILKAQARTGRPGRVLSEETIRNRYYMMRGSRATKRRGVSK
jgi:hypothetical protein